jgi:hypothetical protein
MYNEAVRAFFARDTVASNDVIESRLNEIDHSYTSPHSLLNKLTKAEKLKKKGGVV